MIPPRMNRQAYTLSLLFSLAFGAVVAQTPIDSSKGLKDYFVHFFPIGVAVGPKSLSGEHAQIVLKEFNSLTAENAMKMGTIHPQENVYYWKDADSIVDFAQSHGLKVRGHNLCWHRQTPSWLFKDQDGNQVSKAILLNRLHDHIRTVVGRYKGKVYCWDVVNEAIDDDSSKFLRNSLWYQLCGEEFIVKAFQWAHEADPAALLFYNEYGTEWPQKRARVYRLLKQLLENAVPVNGIGLQSHWTTSEPNETELKRTIEVFSSLGLQVQITELDISVYPSVKRSPMESKEWPTVFIQSMEKDQIKQYQMVFGVFRDLKEKITGVSFWGLSDGQSWLNQYPVVGRKNYPLLFDRDLKKKKVYWKVVDW
jgi:endo-1,4-beta-xylanase